MEDSKHYASDVIAGAFIGIVVGRLITPSGGDATRRLQVVAMPSQAGLRLSFYFQCPHPDGTVLARSPSVRGGAQRVGLSASLLPEQTDSMPERVQTCLIWG